jgi:hypothetical protein
MKKSIILLFFISSFTAFSQKVSNLLKYDSECYDLYEHITSGLKIDSTDKFQSGWLFIKVEKTGKVSEIKVNGFFDEKFISVLKSNIYNPKAPWLKKNKKKYIWYILPMTFGQIQPNSTPKDVQLGILIQYYNLNALREYMISEPGHVVLLNTLKELTNEGMQEVYM